VQVGKEIRLAAAFDLTHEEIRVCYFIANISPRWKIFHKHFMEEIVVDSILELLNLGLVNRSFTQEAPLEGFQKRNLIRRRLKIHSSERFAETLLVLQAAETRFARDIRTNILLCGRLLLFLFTRMLLAVGE
jgi:hypothetical protein